MSKLLPLLAVQLKAVFIVLTAQQDMGKAFGYAATDWNFAFNVHQAALAVFIRKAQPLRKRAKPIKIMEPTVASPFIVVANKENQSA